MKKNIFKTLVFISLSAAAIGCSNPSTGQSAVSSSFSTIYNPSSFAPNNYQGVAQLRNVPDLSKNTFSYDDSYKAFAAKMNAFSIRLSEVFAEQNYDVNTNFTISPYSIELCLGLAIRCASGETRQEMLDAIGVDYDTFNRHYLAYFAQHNYEIENHGDNPNALSTPNNSIWIQKDKELKEDGLNALQNDYASDVFYADFARHTSDACEAIKNYISDKTHGMLAPNLTLEPLTLFVLMNTIYLKDVWSDCVSYAGVPLDLYQFKNANGTLSNKKMIGGTEFQGKPIETEDYSAFYTQTENHFRITFIKPNDGKTIKQVFNKENIAYVLGNNYETVNDEKKEKYVTACFFPEFEANADLDLMGTFKEKFNVKKLFSASCDLSNITDESAYVSQFKHVAKLDVNKEGIEAAAVTYMAVPTMAGGDEYKTIHSEFAADKEFGYILSARGDILFSGVVTNID